MKNLSIFGAFLIAAFLICAGNIVFAQTTWTGTGTPTTDWGTPGNWSNGVPTSTTNTTIQTTGGQPSTGAVARQTANLSLIANNNLILGINAGGSITASGNITTSVLAQAVAIRGGGDLTGNNLTINGATNFGSNNQLSSAANASIGSLTITGATTISATTAFSVIGGAVSLGALTVNSTLNMTAGSGDNGTATGGTNLITASSLAGSGGTIQANKAGTTGHLTINGSASTSYGGTIVNGAGTVRLTKEGSAIQTLTGTNTYSGATTINGGALLISGSGAINSTSGITVNSGGTLRYNSTTGLDRNITLNSGGTFAHNGTNSYTGTLTWTAGTLAGTNWNGAQLNNLTIGAGQIISPGNSPGTANTVNQTWAGGGSYLWEINNATGTAGADPGWDLLLGTGTLTITATELNPFTIYVTSLTLGNTAGDAVNFDNTLPQSWLIADFGNPISGFDANKFAIDLSGFTNPILSGSTFAVVLGGVDNSQLFLVYDAIPEPGTGMLLLMGAGLLAWRRRRSRNAAQ